jgi:hypothetical protein
MPLVGNTKERAIWMTSSNREQIRAVLAEIRAEILRLQYKNASINTDIRYTTGARAPLWGGAYGGIQSGGYGGIGSAGGRAGEIGADIGFDSTD